MMRRTDIPAFVQELLDAGADVWAFDERHWTIGDAEAPKALQRAIYAICDEYGTYDHLVPEIGQYLLSIGRLSPYMYDA